MMIILVDRNYTKSDKARTKYSWDNIAWVICPGYSIVFRSDGTVRSGSHNAGGWTLEKGMKDFVEYWPKVGSVWGVWKRGK